MKNCRKFSLIIRPNDKVVILAETKGKKNTKTKTWNHWKFSRQYTEVHKKCEKSAKFTKISPKNLQNLQNYPRKICKSPIFDNKSGRTQSLNTVLTWDGIEEGYMFGMCNVGIDGKKVTMPLYLAMFL